MISEEFLRRQLQFVVTSSEFSFLGPRYEGKVRDSYISGNKRFLVTTDRLSCFDVVVTTIPFKGEILNTLAVHWFNKSRDIVDNHLIDSPHPMVMVARNCEIVPVEVVLRAYLAGSAYRDYRAGKEISGISLPPGLKMSQKLPEVIITPATKAAKGEHDLPISEKEIIASGLVDELIWCEIKEKARALFEMGQKEAEKRGLILVDTKYEFGLLGGKVVLADEVHTLDSSRYWKAASYDQRFREGADPEMLDKEPTRQWLIEQGFMGEGPVPVFTDDHRISIAQRYIEAYELLTGKVFNPAGGDYLSEMETILKGLKD